MTHDKYPNNENLIYKNLKLTHFINIYIIRYYQILIIIFYNINCFYIIKPQSI
jgi:hypothetical protein